MPKHLSTSDPAFQSGLIMMALPPNQYPVNAQNLVKAIDQRLPQTQCGKCDYPNCLDYARAISAGEADINQCPPGGDITIDALAQLLQREVRPLNPENGCHQPLRLAFIEENACIGCKLCIKACPVDCIVGAVKLMHTVISNDCTGCELCLPVCPTDCISMVDLTPDRRRTGDASMWPEFGQRQVDKARQRTAQKHSRLARLDLAREQQRRDRRRETLKMEILAAVKRKQQS